jgi:hypothetical protein
MMWAGVENSDSFGTWCVEIRTILLLKVMEFLKTLRRGKLIEVH